MGLDMRPIGKPIPGHENEFIELFDLLTGKRKQKFSFFDKLSGKKIIPKDALLEQWLSIQIPSYETIKAPKVGRDREADEWIREKFKEQKSGKTESEYVSEHQGYYVIELAKELDGVPNYVALDQDRNVFRGQFLKDCIDLIGEELVYEAWETKLAHDALDYGERLMMVADRLADRSGLQYLKTQRALPDCDEDSIEWKLHIIYSLAKWLIFYGKNGHGYEADF